MALNSDGPGLRGQKEIVNGHMIDQQGAHVNEKALEEMLLKAAKGESPKVSNESHSSSFSREDGPAIEGDSDIIDGKLISRAGVHLDRDSLFATITSKMGLKSSKNAINNSKTQSSRDPLDLGMYQPIWEELQKIPFSENSEQEILIIAKAVKEAAKTVKEASMGLKAKKIIANTQSLAKNAQKFYYSNEGMRIVFSILGNRFSMAAKGDFTGSEAFYIQVNGDTLDGIVLRKEDDGNYTDVSGSYSIKINQVKE